ncbi:hypothetical protein RB595_003829 [Gaeumannomyces hyphopodioides]
MTIDPTPNVGLKALAKLKGRTLHVPDPSPWYSDMPSGFDRHYARLVPKVDEILASLIPDPKALKKAKGIDVTHLTCVLFPVAEWDVLLIFAHYTVWIFLWDDEIDRGLPGLHGNANGDGAGPILPPTIASDLGLGNAYRAQSLRYIGHHLGIHEDPAEDGAVAAGARCRCWESLGTDGHGELVPPTPASGLYVFIGRELRARCDAGEIRRFWDQIRGYAAATAVEQAQRLSGRFPSLEEYWRMRYCGGGALIHAALALMRCGNNATVSLNDLSEPIQNQVDIMLDEFNKNILVSNDIFSLKKELAEGTIVSVFTIALAEADVAGGDHAQQILAEAVIKFEETTRAAVEAAGAIRRQAQHAAAPGHAESAAAFASSLEVMLHGFLKWTLHTNRYGMKGLVQPDGSIIIKLSGSF